MNHLETFLMVAGVLHFGILIASALVPKVLDWRGELRKLPSLFAQLVWVHGGFIVLTIIGLGAISVINASELASGTPLARSVCGFIALFWGTRVAVQFFYFDAKPFLTNLPLKLGYHGLTVVFTYLTLVYTLGAVARHV
jgi:hypothetical protein